MAEGQVWVEVGDRCGIKLGTGVGTNSEPSLKEGVMARAEARHILVDSEEKCSDIKRQIEGGADFSEMAKVHSSCPSGKQGGALGEFSPGEMVPEFDSVVFSAEVGKVHGPVKTNFGYHLIEITSRL